MPNGQTFQEWLDGLEDEAITFDQLIALTTASAR